mmetsp:Transcript_15803/g.47145  ORF Transcript_15803/g.47145 Transcript_15803/m.47145 type:complete len:202 (+) Transcript_15803:442-1047(+)
MSGASRMREGFVGTGRASAAVRVDEPSSRLGSAMTSSAERKRSKEPPALPSAEKRKILPELATGESRAPSDDRRRPPEDRGRSAERIARRNSTSTGRALPPPSEGGASLALSAWFASSKSIDVRLGIKRSEDGVRAGDRVGVAARGGLFVGVSAGGRSSWFFGRLAAGERGGVAALTREDIVVFFMCVRAVGLIRALVFSP